MNLEPPNPIHWRLSTLLKIGPEDIHEVACRAVGTLAAYRLVLGRCLLAMDQSKGYRSMGYSTSIHYACARLGLSCREARESRRVAERLQGLPELTLAAEFGRISWCKLREIVRIASPATECYWVRLAQTRTASEIEILVARTPDGSIPGEEDEEDRAYRSELRCTVKPEVFMMLEHARRAYSVETGEAVTSADVVELALASYIEGRPVTPETLERVRAETNKDVLAARARLQPIVEEARELAEEMGLLQPEDELEDASSAPDETEARKSLPDYRSPSDSQRLDSSLDKAVEEVLTESIGLKATQVSSESRPIWVDEKPKISPKRSPRAWRNVRLRFNPVNRFSTPAQRREILRRDGWCCRTPGCPNRIWLHLHHLHEYSKGGQTTFENQAPLCTGCHKNVHEGLLVIERRPDGALIFTDAKGRRLDKQADLELAGWLDFYSGWSGGEFDSHQARVHNQEWTVYGPA